MAESLTEYLKNLDIKVKYLHHDIDTLDRIEILRDLRSGEIDVLVGINLLREGLDLPEVSLIALLEADKEGFLRNETSLIQIIGRAARNAEGRVIMYADSVTESMEKAITETERRRNIQTEYNKKHGITPRTIIKPISDVIGISQIVNDYETDETEVAVKKFRKLSYQERKAEIEKLTAEMRAASERLDFEFAAQLRDKIKKLKTVR